MAPRDDAPPSCDNNRGGESAVVTAAPAAGLNLEGGMAYPPSWRSLVAPLRHASFIARCPGSRAKRTSRGPDVSIANDPTPIFQVDRAAFAARRAGCDSCTEIRGLFATQQIRINAARI